MSKHTPKSPLDCIHIVMIETTLPANIGSAARAMMTMGLSQLTLVNPKNPVNDDSYAHAKGGHSILDNATYTTSLDDAISECSLIIAASARNRHLPRPMLSPALAAQLIDDFIQAQSALGTYPHIALLFGRENRGLTNAELALAHYHLQIPANPAYPVLNVASSIQVIAASLYAHVTTQSQTSKATSKQALNIYPRQAWDEAAITQADAAKLYDTIMRLMTNLDLAKPQELATLPNRLARLSQRLQLDKKEYALLMALLHQLLKRTQHSP